MKLIFFAAMMLHLFIAAAQEGNDYLLERMHIDNSAQAYLIKNNGDTLRANVRFSTQLKAEHLQFFVYAEYAKDSMKMYSPADLKGFTLLIPGDTLVYTSENNALNLLSVLTKGSSYRKQKVMTGTGKVFLNCLVKGQCTLYKYITSGQQVAYHHLLAISGPVDSLGSETEKEQDLYVPRKYCVRKAGGQLITLTDENLEDFFIGCPDIRARITNKTVHSETSLKALFSAYNKWYGQNIIENTRY